MEGSSLTLGVALVGVLGTLLSPLLSQRLLARTQSDLFEREQQALRNRRLQEQAEGRLIQRRESYAAVNAALRRYRVELMNYLWDVSRGQVPTAAVERLEAARHTHHAAYAEAQMIASSQVLEQLQVVVDSLSQGYRKTKNLEEGNPDADGSFDEIRDELNQLWDQLAQMRGVMRSDLGVEDP